MAGLWKETLEPYVKVTEGIRATTITNDSGTDLIIGAAIVSDSGPSTPVYITSQSEFLKYFSSEDLTQSYVKSLDSLYKDGLASRMWLNAYRMAGSTHMLLCRASKMEGSVFIKDFNGNEYLIRNGVILKRMELTFVFVEEEKTDESSAQALSDDNDAANETGSTPSFSGGHKGTGEWTSYSYSGNNFLLATEDAGIFGNAYFSSEGSGTLDTPAYDNYVESPKDLIEALNKTSKFYCIEYTIDNELPNDFQGICNDEEREGITIKGTCWVGENWIDKDQEVNRLGTDNGMKGLKIYGSSGDFPYDPDFQNPKNYIINVYNSKSPNLKVVIRRFNHNAVSPIKQEDDSSLDSPKSPYKVLGGVLAKECTGDNYTPKASFMEYDFYEISVKDPSIMDGWYKFTVGNLEGRGDILPEEISQNLGMIDLKLPDDLSDWADSLEVNYYGWEGDNKKEKKKSSKENDNTLDELVISDISVPEKLLNVTDQDILNAFDKIEDDERYIVEGLTDLGNTESGIQNYIASIAKNSNYFYPVSTVYSTNHLTVANKASKIINADSLKTYFLSPWDLDNGTVGFKYEASPATLYWELVSKNRRANNEFRGAFGTEGGLVNVVNLSKEFSKTERQLLLGKKINTIFHDLYRDSIYINDNKTTRDELDVMQEECNARLQIRISKYMPVILKKYIGRQNSLKTALDAEKTIKDWFQKNILSLNYSCADYRVQVADVTDFSTNTMTVKIQVKFYNSVKYIEVYNEGISLDLDFE